MSRYEDAFEQLSERGQPVGSDGLVQMLGNPDFLVSIEPESPRRLVGSGPFVAVATGVGVVVLGFVLWSGAGSGNVAEDEHVPVGPITWTLGDETAYFGPGGVHIDG